MMLLLPLVPTRKGGQTLKAVGEEPNQADLLVMKDLYEQGKVRPVIDRRFGFDQVPDAIRYVENGHAAGPNTGAYEN